MDLLNNFYVKGNKIFLNSWEVILRRWNSVEKTSYKDEVLYLSDESKVEVTENIVPKHQLMEVLSVTPLENSQYSYMEGLQLVTSDFNKEIEEIASYGSEEVYKASLPTATDEYLLDLDFRLSMVELLG